MKKSTKIILPALALLVLGTTAAATSTVAWFAANGTVKATGMEVVCQTSHNLIISNTDPNTFTDGAENYYGSSVASANDRAANLMPASTGATVLEAKTPGYVKGNKYSTTDSAADKFFYTKEATTIDAVSGNVVAGSEIVATTASEVANTHFAQHDFWVANSAKSVMQIKIDDLKVTTKTGAKLEKAITKALRVGIVYQDRTVTVSGSENGMWSGIYHASPNDPIKEATLSYQGFIKGGTIGAVPNGDGTTYMDNGQSPAAMSELVSSTLVPDNADIIIGKIKSTETAVSSAADYEWSKFTVYVWYEGQDKNCTSNNAMSIEDVKIELALTASQAQQSQN